MEICIEHHLSGRPCARGCGDSVPVVKEPEIGREAMRAEEAGAEGGGHRVGRGFGWWRSCLDRAVGVGFMEEAIILSLEGWARLTSAAWPGVGAGGSAQIPPGLIQSNSGYS